MFPRLRFNDDAFLTSFPSASGAPPFIGADGSWPQPDRTSLSGCDRNQIPQRFPTQRRQMVRPMPSLKARRPKPLLGIAWIIASAPKRWDPYATGDDLRLVLNPVWSQKKS